MILCLCAIASGRLGGRWQRPTRECRWRRLPSAGVGGGRAALVTHAPREPRDLAGAISAVTLVQALAVLVAHALRESCDLARVMSDVALVRALAALVTPALRESRDLAEVISDVTLV